jgi:hypothetical protein
MIRAIRRLEEVVQQLIQFTTRKKINSDRHSEALQWNRRRSSIWRPLLRRFWTAAANKQILTGHPRWFKCVPQRIRKNINANFILPLYYSLSRTFSCSSPSHHFITTARPLVLKKEWAKTSFDTSLLCCSTPCFQFQVMKLAQALVFKFQVMKFWYGLRQISIIFLGFRFLENFYLFLCLIE